MHANEINVKNRVQNYYFDNLDKVKKFETENSDLLAMFIVSW